MVLLSSYVAEFLNGPRPCCCCCWLKVPRAVMARLLLWLLVLLPRNEFDRFHLTEKYYRVFQDEKINAGCFKMRKLIQGVCCVLDTMCVDITSRWVRGSKLLQGVSRIWVQP